MNKIASLCETSSAVALLSGCMGIGGKERMLLGAVWLNQHRLLALGALFARAINTVITRERGSLLSTSYVHGCSTKKRRYVHHIYMH
jgi:hypothetical protein